MKLINNYYTGYEELKTFYPLFYHEVYEIDEILKAEGKLVDDVRTGIERVFGNRFITTADSETISVYENIMGISPDMTKSLEERRLLVKTLLSGSGKLSASQIGMIVKSCTGADSDIRFEKKNPDDDHDTVIIKAECGSGDIYFDNLDMILRGKLPSHLDYHIEFDYNNTIEIISEIHFYQTPLPPCGKYSCGQTGRYF